MEHGKEMAKRMVWVDLEVIAAEYLMIRVVHGVSGLEPLVV